MHIYLYIGQNEPIYATTTDSVVLQQTDEPQVIVQQAMRPETMALNPMAPKPMAPKIMAPAPPVPQGEGEPYVEGIPAFMNGQYVVVIQQPQEIQPGYTIQ